MSADTIPNEASAWEYDTQIFDGSWHSVVTREHPDILGNTYRNLQPLLADRSTRSAEPAGCMCRDVAFGSHKIAVLMKLPAHMQAEEQARIEAGLSPWITVDACLVEEVNDLWAKGIRTTGCCCGHNKAVGYIGVNEDDILAMKGLGYIVRENTSRPGAQDGFVPKSIKYGDRPAEHAAPVAEAGDGEVSRYIAKCREMSKGENGHTYTWWSRLAELLSTLQAERARADAAEQCAADALARAEKAEGVLGARDLLWRRKDFGRRWTAKTPFGSYFIDASDEPYEWAFREGDFRPVGSVEEAKAAALADFKTRVRSCLLPARASREAQPATDGGDNG